MVRSALALTFSALSLSVLTACTQPTDATTGSDESTALSGGIGINPRANTWGGPTVWNAFVGTAPCGPIATPSGTTWSASYTFQGDLSFCSFAWPGTTAPDMDTLLGVLGEAGVPSQNVIADSTCKAGRACSRPIVAPLDDQGGGGAVSCRMCVTAGVVAGYLDVALPPEMVQPTPTTVEAVVGGNMVTFVQPGGAAAFRVPLSPTFRASKGTASMTGGGQYVPPGYAAVAGVVGHGGQVVNGGPNGDL